MSQPRSRIELTEVRRTPVIQRLERRLFLKQGLSLGALTLLTGCDLTNEASVEKLLNGMSHWNDRVQAFLFNPNKLAPTFPESKVTKPFPFNAYYGESEAPVIDPGSYRLQLSGLIRDRKPWTLLALRELPQISQITRHICVEGWSAIGKWGGVPLRHFLERIDADLTAKYVGFRCADHYYTSIPTIFFNNSATEK